MKKLLLVVGMTAASLLAGCQSTGETVADQPPAAPAGPYTPKGEIAFAASGASLGASFDDTRVVGSKVNLSRRSDGSWAGQLYNGPLDVSVYPDRLTGVDFTLAKQSAPNGTLYTGQHKGRILRFEVTSEKLLVRTPQNAYTLPRTGEGEYGVGGVVKLTGEAAELPEQPWPQFALALAGTF
ncbi:MAG TPA: hypothetical protein VK447_16010 [Myxococcaceae bacterium]|nr:hypothetical protein [Myxococcaceae bacterium]